MTDDTHVATRDADSGSPWHDGELEIQRSAGVVERMDEVGRRVVRASLLEPHRSFFRQLSFVVLGTVDPAGNAWATLRAGHPGFISSPDPRRLSLSLPQEPADPAEAGLRDGACVGVLGIEPLTRRRNRMNGSIRRTEDGTVDVDVVQSFGNCPQYIRLRESSFVREPSEATPEPSETLHALDDHARGIIRRADTFFVASYVDDADCRRQVDVSHRGGKPGFVRLGDDGVLTIPDFAGNLFFNTLGNLLLNPRAGLVFVDFANGDLLHLTGDAEVVLDSPEIASFRGAERLWRFTPRIVVNRPDAVALRWSDVDGGVSRNALLTGSWEEAEKRIAATMWVDRWRPLVIASIVDETPAIRSYVLAPADGAGLTPHLAGQYLTVRLPDAGSTGTYTISVAPSDATYRISVKTDGQTSRRLRALSIGDTVECRPPAGAFTIDASVRRPAVLIAAGIGITPMLAMLRHLVFEGARARWSRPAWLFQCDRDVEGRPFAAEIAGLVEASAGPVRHVRVLSHADGAEPGRDFEISGRLGIEHLKSTLPFDDYDFHVCGPGSFMQSVYDGLRGLNVDDARIHAEAFGPASLTRSGRAGIQSGLPPTATVPVSVTFAASGREAVWSPGDGTLLELAEGLGMNPDHACRIGSCGTCRTRIVAGDVTYASPPAHAAEASVALLCRALPAKGPLVLDV